MASNVNFTIRVTDGGSIRKVTVDASDLQRAINGVGSEASGVSRAMSSFGGQMKSYIGGLVAQYASITAVVGTVVGVTRQAISTNMDFEKKSSELAAVLGKSKSEITGMTEAAKELGRTTQYTATEVEELQIALARLGFSEREIGNMQKSVLKFAAAVNTDLGSAADFAGSALRAFGLESSDATHLLDVMAASTSKSALDFSKLQTSISIVAPVAHSFGISMEDTVALLGTLANAGFDASSASTALRNIFLNLANENGKLAKGLGHTAKTFPEIIAALKECTEKGISLSDALEMTDNRSVSAFSTLVSGAGSAEELRAALDNCNGSLETMYKEMTDNLQGAVDNLKSAWEGWLLSMNGGDGTFANVINYLANLINGVTTLKERISELPGVAQWAIKSLNPLNPLITGIKSIGEAAGRANERITARQESPEVIGEDEFVGPVLPTQNGTTTKPSSPDPEEVKKFSEAIAAYRKSVQSAVQTNAVFNAGWDEAGVKLKAMESGITALIGKYGVENKTVQKLIGEYKEVASARMEMDRPLDLLDPSKLTGKAITDIGSKLKEPTEGVKTFVQEIDKVGAAQDAISALGSTFSSLSSMVGEGAAAWLDWGSNLLSAIAQAIPAIASLTAAKKQEANANAEAMATGAGSSVASIPLVGPVMAVAAIASVIAALSAIPKFAKGAIAYGPTLGLFGEYPGASHNPEVVAPLSSLTNILGASGGGAVEFHISARELYGVLEERQSFIRRGR